MSAISAAEMLLNAQHLMQCIREEEDIQAYQNDINSLIDCSQEWIHSRKESGITPLERQQMERLQELFQSMQNSLNAQRKALHRQLYKLNSAKKLDSTYGL